MVGRTMTAADRVARLLVVGDRDEDQADEGKHKRDEETEGHGVITSPNALTGLGAGKRARIAVRSAMLSDP